VYDSRNPSPLLRSFVAVIDDVFARAR